MKVAILLADHIPSHRHCYSGGDYPNMFANLFLQTSLIVDIDVYDVTVGEYPSDATIYDAFIITGSKASAFDDQHWILHLKHRIQRYYHLGKKLIGICFGHQILASALGGEVRRSTKGWTVGIETVQMIIEKPWMNPFTDYISLVFYHQDQIIRLPKQAQLLATNTISPVQMFCIEDQVLGIQAHPEMLKAHNHQLLHEFQQTIETQFHRAVDSLRVRDHGKMVGHWILNFIMHKE
ncbi:MAG: glutamine amidotransferase-related protein [Francisellaceae bacterium]